MPVAVVQAIPTWQGGQPGVRWYVLMGYNLTHLVTGTVLRQDVRALHQFAERGVKIGVGVGIWDAFPSESVLDIYYNESCLRRLERLIDAVFEVEPGDGPGVNPERVWSMTVGSEEPHWPAGYPGENPVFFRFNETYHTETGFWFKPFDDMNATERMVLVEWTNEKGNWVFNYMYDYVKAKWPHIVVFQSFFPPQPMNFGAVIFELKADALSIDAYLSGERDNPWLIYNTHRWYTTFAPDKEFHMVLWGQEADAPPWLFEGELGGFEHIRRNAWVSYLAGPNGLAWFDWHPLYGNGWQRTDTMGKRLFLYVNRIANELHKLPLFRARPKVLVIGTDNEFTDPEVGWPVELGLFTEYDIMDHRYFAKEEVDLSQYELVIHGATLRREEFVEKLNDYVSAGGNLVFLGGIGDRLNVYENATRETLISIEKNSTEYWMGEHINISISLPNPLGLELEYDAGRFEGKKLKTLNLTGDYHPVGEFHRVLPDNSTIPVDGYPLLLYHNSSQPNSGWILYWGMRKASEDAEYDTQTQTDMALVRYLMHEVIQSYALNFLNMNGSVSTPDTEQMLITQSMVEEGTILAALSNFMVDSWDEYMSVDKDVNYTLDLEQFDLPDGEYWVHSVDKNQSLGSFTSDNALLEIPVHVAANDTRLLLISQDRPQPNYTINIFPPVPTPEEVELATLLSEDTEIVESPYTRPVAGEVDLSDAAVSNPVVDALGKPGVVVLIATFLLVQQCYRKKRLGVGR